MYYVIKKQPHSDTQCFVGFQVTKYLVPKNSENVIFEFIINDKAVKKWMKKDEVILLTKDKNLFIKTMDQFKEVEAVQKKLVDSAREELKQAKQNFTETLNNELNEFTTDDAAAIAIE